MSEKKVTSNIKLEGARLISRNFQGKQTTFNAEGNRNFGVLIDDELADDLLADGWNVKYLTPRSGDPADHKQAWLPVKVKFGKIPPVVVLINSMGKIKLDESTIGQLDWSVIKNADLIIRPYNYPAMKGRSAGVSAYLKSLYVTVSEDDLAMKYANIPEINADPNTVFEEHEEETAE